VNHAFAATHVRVVRALSSSSLVSDLSSLAWLLVVRALIRRVLVRRLQSMIVVVSNRIEPSSLDVAHLGSFSSGSRGRGGRLLVGLLLAGGLFRRGFDRRGGRLLLGLLGLLLLLLWNKQDEFQGFQFTIGGCESSPSLLRGRPPSSQS
jgi:hypothetical protein